jgi:DNA-binding MarR family transcriptional regulator
VDRLVVYIHIMIADAASKTDLLLACACHRARMAARAVTRMYDERLRPSGLRATQLLVLLAAASSESLSITQLADRLGMDRTTLKRVLTPLEAGGLVKLGNEGWRRSRTIRITALGRRRMEATLPLWDAAQGELKARLGEPDWRKAIDALGRITDAAAP